MVRDVAAALAAEYPGLEVHGVAGDFERHLDEIPPPQPGSPRIVAFLGGTIGNFPPGSRRRFLRSIAGAWTATATCCSAPTSSRTRACSRRPTTTAPG